MAIHSPLGAAPPSPAGERWLVVSFHDLAPHTQRPCQELLMLLAELGIPRASLLVVPRWHGLETILERPFFLRWLRSLAEAGHEICLHAGEGELHGAGREQAEARIREGLEILAAAGLPAHGLVAPAWLLAAPTVAFSTRGFLRRWLSPLAAQARFAASRRQPILRVSVHPQDLYEPGVRRALVSVLRRALADRAPVTCGELARTVTPSHG
jgi:predicted deacetylase